MNQHTLPKENATETVDSLLAQGETALLQGHFSLGLKYFDAVLKLDASDPKIYYAQGLSLFEFANQDMSVKVLLLASKKFKIAAKLSPHDFETWLAWGNLLCALGLKSGEHHYFLEAKEKLNQAVSLSENQPCDVLAELYWEYGVVFTRLAEHSGEAMEWHQAIEAFQLAHSLHEKHVADFFNDYGYACLKFASQINNDRFYLKAIHCLKAAISMEKDRCDSWCVLAESLENLYFHTYNEDHFSQACHCFDTAAKLRPHEAAIWLNWAQFLCKSATTSKDVKRLRLCIEKCQHAFAIDPNNSLILAVWGEALALLGSTTDRLDLIYEAENKIVQAMELQSEEPEVWYSYGICMQAFGRYFNEADDYYQAIEKFQEGLSIDRTCHRHWHAIGQTYSLIGEMENDPKNLELSLRFFQKALDLNASTDYLFDYATTLLKLGEMTHEQRWLEGASWQFERLLSLQKNATYLHPDWLFHYACTLDALGDFHEEEFFYLHAIDIFSHVLMIDPDFSSVHHELAIALAHLGELTGEVNHFYRAVNHFRLSLKNDDENDKVLFDWATTLINIATRIHDVAEADLSFREAENKLQAVLLLGNAQACYQFACLYSLLGQCEKGMHYLRKARRCDALPPIDEMVQDDWLDNLRSTGDFQEFLSALDYRRNFQEEC